MQQTYLLCYQILKTHDEVVSNKKRFMSELYNSCSGYHLTATSLHSTIQQNFPMPVLKPSFLVMMLLVSQEGEEISISTIANGRTSVNLTVAIIFQVHPVNFYCD